MNWKIWLLEAITAAYFVQWAILLFTKDFAQAAIIFGYAIANCGLIWTLLK